MLLEAPWDVDVELGFQLENALLNTLIRTS